MTNRHFVYQLVLTKCYRWGTWAWGLATAWRTLPVDLALGAVEVISCEGLCAVVTSAKDEDRTYLYSWCMRGEDVS